MQLGKVVKNQFGWDKVGKRLNKATAFSDDLKVQTKKELEREKGV